MEVLTTLEQKLLEWEELYHAGQVVPAEELTNDPQLIEQLQARIDQLLKFDELVGDLGSEFDTRPEDHARTRDHREFSTVSSFRSLKFHESGGRGEIYEAEDTELKRRVAIKWLRRDLSDGGESTVRFRFEAEATSQLDHPGVAPVYTVGRTDDGRLFYAMRFVRGVTLEKEINAFHGRNWTAADTSEYRQQFKRLLRHLVSAAKTIAYAHQRYILNLDVKPLNIMVGKYGETLVVDWGESVPIDEQRFAHLQTEGPLPVARRHSDSDASPSRAGGGTLPYMAPERMPAASGSIGPATDIYSLGIALYRVLTGEEAFTYGGASREKIIARIENGQYRRPSAVKSNVPRPLEAICEKAISLRPTDRYDSALDFARDIQRWLDDEPVEAYRETLLEVGGRWARRHKTAAWLTGAFSVAVLLVAVIALSKISSSATSAALARELHGKAEGRFDTALATFEQLSGPLANADKSRLDVFNPLAKNIREFTDEFAHDSDITERGGLRLARILELRALANSVLQRESAELLQDLKQAEFIYEQHSETFSDDFSRWRLARNLLIQGRVKIQDSELGAARDLLGQAEEQLRALKDLPNPPVELRILERYRAEAHHSLGECYMALARGDVEPDYEMSEQHFDASRAIRQRLVDGNVGDRDVGDGLHERQTIRRDLARSHGYLGDLYLRRGDIEKAENAYQESLKIRKRLYSENPVNAEHRFQYARGLANFAAIERVQNRDPSTAVERLEEALQVLESLSQDYSEDTDFKLDRARTWQVLAETQLFFAAPASDELRERHLGLAFNAAQQSRIIYKSLRMQDIRVARGLALSAALAAESKMESNPAEATRYAKEGLKYAEALPEKNRNQDDLFCLSVLKGCLDQPSEAFEAFCSSIEMGANTVERFRMHCHLGLRHLADDPEFSTQLKGWIEKSESRAGL